MVVAEAMRDLLKARGYAKIESNQERSETAFLVGYRGNLYRFGVDYSVVQHIEPFDAIGSGYAFALGALEALKGVDMKPKARIRAALRIATRYANGVDDNYVIMRVKA
jgi:ATP-dependent protease HslVU (ClpYQ) peptidase subunit